ncbi:MAG: hypothetical protein M1528_02180 [Candidatus Marsarchaeota archaeon]|nr:hypothetical protein [Candidatus Marsarchaeota archaeon]MCL5115317.1 hypothetical protein [Candidatus Marsarchaeota archaeon]
MGNREFWIWNWRYFWGVGVGLVIAWVTSAIAYFKTGASVLPKLILLELVLSAIFLIVGAIWRLKQE